MNFHVITLFPEMFTSYLNESILARGIKEKKISVKFYNPRLFVTGKYKKVWPDGNVSQIVDDRPYGGGPGMIIRAEPVLKAVEKALTHIFKKAKNPTSLKLRGARVKIINFAPGGKKFTTNYAKNAVKKYTDVILISGRYEGIDARVKKILKSLPLYGGVEDISIGDYILTGGELPAMVLVDCMSRQVEGVLGKFESLEEERVSASTFYTRPEILEYKGKKYRVPKVLLSGHAKNIEDWKKKQK